MEAVISFERYLVISNLGRNRFGFPVTWTSMVQASFNCSFSLDVICLNSHSRGFPFSSFKVDVGAYLPFFFSVLFALINLLNFDIFLSPFFLLND